MAVANLPNLPLRGLQPDLLVARKLTFQPSFFVFQQPVDLLRQRLQLFRVLLLSSKRAYFMPPLASLVWGHKNPFLKRRCSHGWDVRFQ